MRRISPYVPVMTALSLLFSSGAYAVPAAPDLPLFGGKPAVALINGEPLLLEEFERLLIDIHGGMEDNAARSTSHPSQLLDRLINAKLVLQEARNIGLDELPEVRSAQKVFEEDTLRGMLFGYHVRNILKPDRNEVEKRYREAVKEVKVISVLFGKEEDAGRMATNVKAGSGFEELAKKAIDSGEAKGSPEGQYLKFRSLSPDVASVVASLKNGEVGPVIRIGNRFSLVKLEGTRYPEDRAARKKAEEDALQAKRADSLRKYVDGLRKRYVKVDRPLLDALDFESAEPGFDRLRADGRVLATVKGEGPVTVGDLTKAIEKKFFHGAERAAEGKKINRVKDQAFEEILNRRVTILEAKKRKLDRTEYFKVKAQENRNGILFGAFVQKAITPEVKVTPEDLDEYYRAHIGEYTFPEMVRIDGLEFSEQGKAEEAIEKLRKGSDFQWLRANAEGRIGPASAEDLLLFRGEMLAVTTLPEGVLKAIDGAMPGDYRLYADPGKAYYVLGLLERLPSRPMPLESVKGEIEKTVFKTKLERVLRDWEEKLRKASDVKIYATGKKLDRIIDPGAR